MVLFQNFSLNTNGVYLITGGLGGIGLEIAGFFVGEKKVKLALITRTPLPPEEQWDDILKNSSEDKEISIINKIKNLKKMGQKY